MWQLDHLAIGARTLSEGVAWAQAQLGCTLLAGGQHVRFGTHNRLLGMSGGLYLEVIAPDPDVTPDRPRWFGLDNFEGPPRLCNWICRTDDLSGALAVSPPAAGHPEPMSRGDLHWSIAVPADGSLPLDGAWPTLIQWAPGTVHPADRLENSGLTLVALTIRHPEAVALSSRIEPYLRDPRVTFVQAPDFAMSAVLRHADGHEVVL